MSFGLTYARHKAVRVVNRIDHMANGLTDTAINELYQSDNADLLFESVTLEELDSTLFYGIESGNDFMMEAISAKKVNLSRTMQAFSRSLGSALNGTGLTASKDVEISKPRKSGPVAVMTARIAISDGQSVSVVFHAPDNDPLKINENDTLIAFRFMLNSRDVTHVVAPSGGSEVSLKQVTMALSNLAEKNSEKFQAKQSENNGFKQEIEQAEQQAEQLEADLLATSDLIAQTENETIASNNNCEKLQNRIDKQNALQELLQSEIDDLKAQKMPEPEPQPEQQPEPEPQPKPEPESGDAGGAEPEQVSNDTPEGAVIGKGGYFTFNDTVWNVLDITSESVAIQARGDDRVEYLKKGDLLAKRYVFTGFNDESENQLNEAETIASKLDLTQYVSEVRGKPMLSFDGQDVAYDALREAGFSIDDARIAAQKIRVDFNMGDYNVIKNPLATPEPEPTYEHRYLDRVSRIEAAETTEEVEAILSEEQGDSEHTPEGGQQVEDAANYRKLQLRFAKEKELAKAMTDLDLDPIPDIDLVPVDDSNKYSKLAEELQATLEEVREGNITLREGKNLIKTLIDDAPNQARIYLEDAAKTNRKKDFISHLTQAVDITKDTDSNAPYVKADGDAYDFNLRSYDMIDEIGMFGKSWDQVGKARPDKLFQYIEELNLPGEVLDAAKAYYGQQAEPEPQPEPAPAEPEPKPKLSAEDETLIAKARELGAHIEVSDNEILFSPDGEGTGGEAGELGDTYIMARISDWIDDEPKREEARKREAQRETLAKFVKGVRMPKGWKLDKSEIDEEIWPRVYIETPFEKHDMNGSLGYVLVPAHDDVTKVNLTYHEGSELKDDVQSVKEAVSIIEDELTGDSPESLKDFLDDLDEDAVLSPEAQALVDKYKERNGLNEPEPEPEQPASELDTAVASLKELVASSGLNSDEYMERMEKAFTAITEADKLDEYEPLMNEAADKLTAIMDAEERGEVA